MERSYMLSDNRVSPETVLFDSQNKSFRYTVTQKLQNFVTS